MEDTLLNDNKTTISRPLTQWKPYEYMTTEEAADYMRRSVSWMLHRKDIPFYAGKPNLYKKADLDHWMDKNRRYQPKKY